MDSRLLEIYCCPITRRPLNRMAADNLEQLNAAISAGKIRTHGGSQLQQPLVEALVTMDGDLVYPVHEGIPVLLAEECINWAAFNN